MRLIDADEAKKFYKENLILPEKSHEIIVRTMIDAVPTAYDLDKVVEELEKNASRYTKKYTTPYGNKGYKDTKAISIHKAIEIVKHGGVSEAEQKLKAGGENEQG